MGRHAAGHELDAATVQIAAVQLAAECDAPGGDVPGPRWARWLWVGAAAASALGIGLASVTGGAHSASSSSARSSSDGPSIDYSDPAVSAYLSELTSYGSTTPDTDGWVLAGYQACDWYSQGYTTTEVMEGLTEHYASRLGLPNTTGWVADGSANITRAAMLEFCPAAGASPAARR